MYILSVNMWFQKLMKQFFFGIDQVVYNLISEIYDLLIVMARTSIFSQADIIDMSSRIYRLLAVFMVFKVTFSLIMYVVNPDDFSDKSKGISKLGTNIVISLALLILTPYVFNYAYRLQTIILEDNSLATLIFGATDDEQQTQNSSFLNSAGDKMAFITMSAFFKPNVSIDELHDCVYLTQSNGKFNPDCSGLGENYENLYTEYPNSMAALTRKADNKSEKNPNFYYTTLVNYVSGVENENLGLMFRQDMAVATDSSNSMFIMDYKYIFSTVVGVIIIILLVTFFMDVALRSIKLAFLQLIAPIPIISYVDPKSGKDGMFKKWYQLCFKTYLSLFVRLLALYFAIFIIQKVSDLKLVDVVDGSYQNHPFIYIFVIIGALMFAKQLPKILEGLGIKLDGGGFSLNPLKKFENEALGGKGISKFAKAAPAAGLAGAAAMGANALSSAQRFKEAKGWKDKTKAAFRGLGSVVAGGTSATSRGLVGAVKGEKFGKNFSNSYGIAMKNKQSRSDRISDDVSWPEMMGAKFTQTIGGHTKGERVKVATETSKKIQNVYDSMMNAAKGNDKATFTKNINGEDMTFKGIKGLSQFIDELNKTSIDRKDYTINGHFNEKDYLAALAKQQELKNALEDAMKERLDAIASGAVATQDDATTDAIREGFKQMKALAGDLNKITDSVDPKIGKINVAATANVINGTSKGISNQITASTEASHATTVDQYAAKKKQS